MTSLHSVYIIACGALAAEIQTLKRWNQWDHFVVEYLTADLHNTPQHIVPQVRAKLIEAKEKYHRLFVGYGDCGTGGQLDKLLQEFGAERLPGAHCYEFFAGNSLFTELSEQEPGTFYLTDFLAQNFERLIIRGLGIDRHPELQELYFGNYQQLVYLAQTPNPKYLIKAKQAAEALNLPLEIYHTSYGQLETSLSQLANQEPICHN